MLNVVKYSKAYSEEWDGFVRTSNVDHFMFERLFLEYHQGRFLDNSLLFYKEEKLVAVLPANLDKEILYSHQGLSFGGFLTSKKCTAPLVLDLFKELRFYCKKNKIKKIHYKRTPDIYSQSTGQDDLYGLFIEDYDLVRRDLGSIVGLLSPGKLSKGRKWSVNKAKKADVIVKPAQCFSEFWELLSDVLWKHGVSPVHSIEEIKLLVSRFPSNIKLYIAILDGELVAGAVLFVTNQVVHTQYMASNENGRGHGALDFLILDLMEKYKASHQTFSFGVSTELQGRHLNEGLLAQKNGFGAKSMVHDFYEVEV